MTIKEFYEAAGADFDTVLKRFGNEALVQRFMFKFPADKSYDELQTALAAADAETAFRAAHTLKGVCLNLGFENLYQVSSELTEKLRGGELEGSEPLNEKVKEQYRIVMDNLKLCEQSL